MPLVVAISPSHSQPRRRLFTGQVIGHPEVENSRSCVHTQESSWPAGRYLADSRWASGPNRCPPEMRSRHSPRPS